MECGHTYTCAIEASGVAYRCQLCGYTEAGGSGVDMAASKNARADLGVLDEKKLLALDAVATLSRVSFNGHQAAPSRTSRLNAINELVNPSRAIRTRRATVRIFALIAAILLWVFSALPNS